MGQVVNTPKRTDGMSRDEKPVYSSITNIPSRQDVYKQPTSDRLESPNDSANTHISTDTQPATNNTDDEDKSSPVETQEMNKRQCIYPYEEPLCAGEILDNITSKSSAIRKVQDEDMRDDSTSDVSEIKESMNWSEKKRQFSMMKQRQSIDSFSSEMSSHSRHSVSSYLYARECDAKGILIRMGFGFGSSMIIPERFWANHNLASSTVVARDWMKMADLEMDDDDIFDGVGSTFTSMESSWSDSSMGQLPSRFTSSIDRLSSVSSLSEQEDNDNTPFSIPSIVEPDNEQGDTFDLMRHLRLNRGNHSDKGFLEPVTEELESSSVGSGSALTKVSAQQDSFDSVGNTSIVTKIWRKGESEDSKEQLERSASVAEAQENNHSIEHSGNDELSDNRNDTNVNSIHNISKDSLTISSCDMENLNLPPFRRPCKALEVPQDSFELEEIATSEENLDNIEEKRFSTQNKRRSHLKRENSDESSGFEDDAQYFLKRRSPENLGLSRDSLQQKSLDDNNSADTEESVSEKGQITHLLVPCEFSTPKNNAASRRSAFVKRHSWSTSKQKRVIFEDETHQRSRSLEDLQSRPSPYRLNFKRHSLDISLPLSNKTYSDAVAECSLPKVDEQSDTPIVSTPLSDTQRTSSENKAISNVKRFMSNLLSIRSKLNNPIRAKLDSLQGLQRSSSETECSSISERAAERSSGMVVSAATLGQAADTRLCTVVDLEGEAPSILLSTSQNSCLEELRSFEEILQKYRAAFIALELISTLQDKYYTRKLQARFAWDILFIRRLRSQIKDELDVMQSNLLSRTGLYDVPLPYGVQDQMDSLSRLQSGLREYLLNLASNSPNFSWKKQTIKKVSTAFRVTNTIEDIENKVRDSVVQEIGAMFQMQINELRGEMKERDSLINELLHKVQQFEQSK